MLRASWFEWQSTWSSCLLDSWYYSALLISLQPKGFLLFFGHVELSRTLGPLHPCSLYLKQSSLSWLMSWFPYFISSLLKCDFIRKAFPAYSIQKMTTSFRSTFLPFFIPWPIFIYCLHICVGLVPEYKLPEDCICCSVSPVPRAAQ